MRKRFDEFVRAAEDFSKAKFKKVPHVDRWSPTAKVSIIAVAVVPPIVFVLFYFLTAMSVWWHNSGVDKKYARLNAERMAVNSEKKDN